MLLVTCPYCGPRPEIEFRQAGEAHIARPAITCSDDEWADFLYMRDNHKGYMRERWRHVAGCGRFFNVVRHTVTDKFVASYKVGEEKPAIPAEAAAGPRVEIVR
ncbi:MAG: sarcosine oxidase subunit delta [Hyphomicrobiaceae bacterium]|nr:sarcosine oxidase subunit delta [Hyphomicrobiaceae bacterium]